jgi:transposase
VKNNRQSKAATPPDTNFRARQAQQQFHESLVSIIQPKADVAELAKRTGGRLGSDELSQLIDCIRQRPLKYRNRAIAILLYHMHTRVSKIANFLGLSHSTVDTWIQRSNEHGVAFLLEPRPPDYRKTKDAKYTEAVFAILHSPPSSFGINRTTWRLKDVHRIMAQRGLPIARNNIRVIIKDAGFRYRKAKKILTRTDPHYLRRKLKRITRILSKQVNVHLLGDETGNTLESRPSFWGSWPL